MRVVRACVSDKFCFKTERKLCRRSNLKLFSQRVTRESAERERERAEACIKFKVNCFETFRYYLHKFDA